MSGNAQKINKGNVKKDIIIVLGIMFLIISIILIPLFLYKKLDTQMLEKNLEVINKECNSVYENIDEKEKKYKKLLEEEKDYFKKGMYANALTQIYAIKCNTTEIMKYAKIAEENYLKVKGGEYYIIADKKYIAWVLLKAEGYSESFKVTSELLELINTNKNGILTSEEILDTKALIYSIFTYIYSHFNLLEKAEFYYEELNKLQVTEKIRISKGDKIAASKMMYADKKGDYQLMKKYAQECYNLSLERDKKNNTNTSDAMLGNLAYANIQLGNYKESLEQIKKAENIYKSIKDPYGLAATTGTYATYYHKIGDVKLATEYYKKTLKQYADLKNYYEVEQTLNVFLKFLEKNKIDEKLDEYYKSYYELTSKLNVKAPMNEFLLQVIKINDELNESTLLLMKEKSEQHKNSTFIAICVILILILLITRMNMLIKVKNESEKNFERIANTDYLTGLNTRAYGEKLILREMKKGRRLSIGVIDIDHFKSINDNHGHIFGDFILKEVAKYIKDSLGEEAIITRFGGEEFTIAFLDKGRLEAKEILDQIREDINSIVFDNNARVSFSAGIKEWNKTDLNTLIKEADELLYEAKRRGRNKVLI
ncbi:MAG: tetratricopeptide repeat-containing diguanylate cyclase [Sarcina sp.]